MGFSAQSGLLSGRLNTLLGYFLCMIMLVIKVRLIVSRRELATPFDLCCQYSAASFLMMKAKVGKRALWIDSNMNCSRA